MNIARIIQEEIESFLEATPKPHFKERIRERLINTDFPFNLVEDDIKFLEKVNFPGQSNVGVKIFSSKEIYSDGKTSKGNNLWVIIRGNEMETIVFGGNNYIPRNIQFTHHINTIKDLVSRKGYDLSLKDIKGETTQKKKRGRTSLDLPTIKIKGNDWYIDSENEKIIYTKNIKKAIPFDDLFDELPEEELERLIGKIENIS